jgi:hypothetical protein
MRNHPGLPPSASRRANGEPGTPTNTDRRTVLSGLAALAIGASAPGIHANPAPKGTTPVSVPPLIDVHHHFIPPFYLAENRERIWSSNSRCPRRWHSRTTCIERAARCALSSDKSAHRSFGVNHHSRTLPTWFSQTPMDDAVANAASRLLALHAARFMS